MTSEQHECGASVCFVCASAAGDVVDTLIERHKTAVANWRKRFDIGPDLDPHGEMQNYDSAAPIHYDGESRSKYYSRSYGGGYVEGDNRPEEVVLMPQHCARNGHTVVEYIGFTECYTYCSVCDEKNPNPQPDKSSSTDDWWL